MSWRHWHWKMVQPVEAGGRGFDPEAVRRFTLIQARNLSGSEDSLSRTVKMSSFKQAKAYRDKRKHDTLTPAHELAAQAIAENDAPQMPTARGRKR